MEPIILVHGGAGAYIDDELGKKSVEGVKAAALHGYKTLKETGNVLDGVEQAVRYLEDNENFNAGKGSVLNWDGEIEMDASIMQGSDLNAGSVTIVKDVKNPISLARLIMEKTPHVLLGAEGAKQFAIKNGLEIAPPGSLVVKRRADDLEMIKKDASQAKHELGTVGAVAVDAKGHVAAATSTGGFHGKMVGRCSDTCVIGSGTYADDASGAVSTTGHGDSIMKFCVAYEIVNRIRAGSNAHDATNSTLKDMTAKLKNTAGAITVTSNGDIGVGFTTQGMSWAYVKNGELHYGLQAGDDICEKI